MARGRAANRNGGGGLDSDARRTGLTAQRAEGADSEDRDEYRQLIDQLEQRLARRTATETLFTIRRAVV